MEHALGLVALAAFLFAVTNVDDVFLLIGFFADPRYGVWPVVFGQVLGIATLYALSVAAALGALLLPPVWIGLLGLVPIWLGAKSLWELSRARAVDDGDEPPAPAGSGLRRLLAVAGVTIANGGDNLGVYTPVFALRPAADVAVIGFVFAAMTGLWCTIAAVLVRHERIGAPIRRHAPRVVPFVLVALGAWIIWEAGTATYLLRLSMP